jgi:hypothetical protein
MTAGPPHSTGHIGRQTCCDSKSLVLSLHAAIRQKDRTSRMSLRARIARAQDLPDS